MRAIRPLVTVIALVGILGERLPGPASPAPTCSCRRWAPSRASRRPSGTPPSGCTTPTPRRPTSRSTCWSARPTRRRCRSPTPSSRVTPPSTTTPSSSCSPSRRSAPSASPPTSRSWPARASTPSPGELKDSVGQFFAGTPASFAIGSGQSTELVGVYGDAAVGRLHLPLQLRVRGDDRHRHLHGEGDGEGPDRGASSGTRPTPCGSGSNCRRGSRTSSPRCRPRTPG